MRRLLRVLLVLTVVAVAGYAGWDRVEAHRLAQDVAAIEARGEPTALPGDTPLPSAKHEEAARLYLEAASRARDIGQRDLRMTRLDVDTVIGSVDVRELESTYKPDAPALQLVDRATPLPFAGFGDTVDGPEWMNTQGLQSLAALSALRADLLAYRGNGDAAAQALFASLRVQRTQPDTFYRYLMGARQFGSLRILVRHAAPSPSALDALQQAFAELPDEDHLAQEIMGRRARLLDQQGAPGPGDLPDIVQVLLHPFVLHQLRVQVEQFDEVIDAARQPWPDKFGALEAVAAEQPIPRERTPLRALIAGPVPNIAVFSQSPVPAGLNLALRRVAVTTLAIERYRRAHAGAPPQALGGIVPAFLPAIPIDPFSGRPLVYKPAADGYVVYSVDANRVDNGGQFYGVGAMSTMAQPKTRDFGINVPLTPRPVRQ